MNSILISFIMLGISYIDEDGKSKVDMAHIPEGIEQCKYIADQLVRDELLTRKKEATMKPEDIKPRVKYLSMGCFQVNIPWRGQSARFNP